MRRATALIYFKIHFHEQNSITDSATFLLIGNVVRSIVYDISNSAGHSAAFSVTKISQTSLFTDAC
jgi:hypothetical protein